MRYNPLVPKDISSLKLNKEQLEAIKFSEGPLLIIAGAGTGKTTVITERIKYLILSQKAKPHEILALTFTEKAAREMEERVDIGLPYGYTQMWISTFHSFCDRILRDNALQIGLDPRYRLMTEAEAIQLLRNHLFDLDLDYFRPLGNPTKFIAELLKHFSRLKDENISPQEYLDYVDNLLADNDQALTGASFTGEDDNLIEIKRYQELANAYQTYNKLLIDISAFQTSFFPDGPQFSKSIFVPYHLMNNMRGKQELIFQQTAYITGTNLIIGIYYDTISVNFPELLQVQVQELKLQLQKMKKTKKL
mgnify:CR=1 FL=1